MKPNPVLVAVTERIRERSAPRRTAYLRQIDEAARRDRGADRMGCANVAHAFAGLPPNDKFRVVTEKAPNIGIVNTYNDMLSAHAPLGRFPDVIKDEARRHGATAQVAGGVPAMCDGVTQGTAGMELSLFSRDVIAMATAVSLSHDVFDAALMLGICDKIVPGLLIGALHFGHVPTVFVPGGPMPSGLSNSDKAKVREQAAQGLVGREALLDAELRAYHSPGTCTFYGTANSNQMLMEAMGLHVPGTAFVNPGNELRDELTREAVRTVLGIVKARPTAAGPSQGGSPPPGGSAANAVASVGARYTPIGRLVDERAIVNAMTALLATGGSTNHLIHWVAVARSAGITINWDDFAQLSAVVPLLARVYPNGSADVNQFQAAGGPGFVIRELLDAGLMHEDVLTVRSGGIREYTREPALTPSAAPTPTLPQGATERDSGVQSAPAPTLPQGRREQGERGREQGQQGSVLPPPLGEGRGGGLQWHDIGPSRDTDIVRPAADPFSATGGLKLLTGNLGRSVIKVSAVPADRHVIEAPARVFNTQEELQRAFNAGELERDIVCVVRWQGPQANGMPELHKLTPPLAVLQGRGFRVALVTDGRMSGASGKVPAAIHVSPEAAAGGPLARLRDGDVVRLDAVAGTLQALVPDQEWAARENAAMPEDLKMANGLGVGRELFSAFRRNALLAEEGACTWL